MVEAMNLALKGFGKSIIEMHCGPTRHNVDVCTAQKLQAFRDKVGDSHVKNSGVEIGRGIGIRL
jgi:hypothetical protein